jgi:methyl-accepting chemotaxis protein-3 (ribose and galactose sensor receptor)
VHSADEALDAELKARYDAYIAGMQPMVKFAKNGMFEAIIIIKRTGASAG